MRRSITFFCLCRPPEPKYVLVTRSLAQALFACRHYDILDYRAEPAEKAREPGVFKRERVTRSGRVPMALGL